MKIIDKRKSLTKHPSKTYRKRSLSAIKNIAIHHSATTSGSAEAFANYHVNELGWAGIGYHYVIDKDGTISWCHDLDVISYHVGNSNGGAIGICLVGDFRTETLGKAQREATIKLTQMLMKDLGLSVNDVLAHQEYPNYSWKQCPAFDMSEFKKDLKNDKKDVKHREANVTYKGKDVDAIIVDGRTYVQVREIAELLKLEVGWDQNSKTVTLK